MATRAVERKGPVEDSWPIGSALGRMAAGATHALVGAIDLPARIARMVETGRGPEAVDGVTALAGRRAGAGELAAVDVAVTAGAIEREARESRPARCVGRVTTGAGEARVAPLERVAGASVIEADLAPGRGAVAARTTLLRREAVQPALVRVAMTV